MSRSRSRASHLQLSKGSSNESRGAYSGEGKGQRDMLMCMAGDQWLLLVGGVWRPAGSAQNTIAHRAHVAARREGRSTEPFSPPTAFRKFFLTRYRQGFSTRTPRTQRLRQPCVMVWHILAYDRMGVSLGSLH